MIPPIDIFRMVDGALVWQEPSPSVDDARIRVQQLGAIQPGEYVIFSQKTGNKISVRVGPELKS
jgi:hypothetical protein